MRDGVNGIKEKCRYVLGGGWWGRRDKMRYNVFLKTGARSTRTVFCQKPDSRIMHAP